MTVHSNALRELQSLRLNLEDVRLQLQRGPKQLAAHRQQLDKKKTELEGAQAEIKRLRMLADQKELHLKSAEQKRAQLQLKLNEAKTNREYQAIKDQIDADKMAGSVLEDEILETYARLDEQKSKLKALDEELARHVAELQAAEASTNEQQRRLTGRTHELSQMLQQAEATLPIETRELYTRLVTARGADAMAGVDDNTCSGCYTAITSQMYNELLMDRLVCCKSCGRLLYLVQ